MKPGLLGLRVMYAVLLLTILYLTVLFGLGEEALPAAIQPQTDLFLFEEMPFGTAAIFCGAVLVIAGALGFASGAIIGLILKLTRQGERGGA